MWNLLRRRAETKKRSNRIRSRSDTTEGRWANLPPKLLSDIIRRVEESESSWPAIVSCASVCKSWREITKQIVKPPEECGRITFPISLKQPGPRESPIQCFIKWDRANAVYRLYFGRNPSEKDKLLLAARMTRWLTSTEFIISLVADNFSKASDTYVGKLRQVVPNIQIVFPSIAPLHFTLITSQNVLTRSNFRTTKFNIYDCLPPRNAAFQQHGQRFHGKQLFARVHTCNCIAATVSYEDVDLYTPRRMYCTMHSKASSTPLSKAKDPGMDISSRITETEPLKLKTKAPLWHENRQFWYLKFKDRAIQASVRNFQLLAAVDDASQENIILQFGKIGNDIFAMDYNYPLSAFQVFAICLTMLGSIRS